MRDLAKAMIVILKLCIHFQATGLVHCLRVNGHVMLQLQLQRAFKVSF
jgi:hypothetical protein